MKKAELKTHTTSHLPRYVSWIVLGLGLVFMMLAQSSFWITNTIYNQKSFTEIATTSLSSDSSREAIAQSIVNGVLSERPLLRNTISGKATSLVSGLLETDFSQQAIGLVVQKSYAYFTSSTQEPIAIDLSALKAPLSAIVWIAERQGREPQLDISRIPDSVTLYEPKDLPNLYGYGIAVLWLGPLFAVLAIALFTAYILLSREHYQKRVYILGAAVIGASALGLLLGPVVPPSVAALISNASSRVVVSNLITALIQPFLQQMIATIFIVSTLLLVFTQRFRLLEVLMNLGVSKKTPAKKSSKIRS